MLLYIYLFFHVLSQQSYALNSLIPNVFTNSKAFFKCDPVNWNFLPLFSTNEWKTALSIWSQLPQCALIREKDILFFSKEVVSLCLSFTHVERVFFRTPKCSYFPFPFPRLYILHPQSYCLAFVLWALFFSHKEPRMVCFDSQRFVYVFKNRMPSSQKVRTILKKLEDIRKSSSYREIHLRYRPICSTYRDV